MICGAAGVVGWLGADWVGVGAGVAGCDEGSETGEVSIDWVGAGLDDSGVDPPGANGLEPPPDWPSVSGLRSAVCIGN